MTWKSTALLSGAGLMATWFASAPPAPKPNGMSRMPATSARPGDVPETDIGAEADRLRVRLQEHRDYQEPSRNPFRFGAPVRPSSTGTTPVKPAEPPPVPETPPSRSLRMVLSGIAETNGPEGMIRTAIISTPSDVFLVRAGEPVGDQYRVTSVSSEAVELLRVDDGSTVTLVLKP